MRREPRLVGTQAGPINPQPPDSKFARTISPCSRKQAISPSLGRSGDKGEKSKGRGRDHRRMGDRHALDN